MSNIPWHTLYKLHLTVLGPSDPLSHKPLFSTQGKSSSSVFLNSESQICFITLLRPTQCTGHGASKKGLTATEAGSRSLSVWET